MLVCVFAVGAQAEMRMVDLMVSNARIHTEVTLRPAATAMAIAESRRQTG